MRKRKLLPPQTAKPCNQRAALAIKSDSPSTGYALFTANEILLDIGHRHRVLGDGNDQLLRMGDRPVHGHASRLAARAEAGHAGLRLDDRRLIEINDSGAARPACAASAEEGRDELGQ
jgi:hypothetical protein